MICGMAEVRDSERIDRILQFCLFAVAAGVCAALCTSIVLSRSLTQGPRSQPDALHQLWAVVIDPRLQRNVQGDQDAYYDGQFLMIPLYAALRRGDTTWQHSFSDHFRRLVQNPSVLPVGPLSRLQYLYLASEFVVLAMKYGHEGLIPAGLPDLLFSETHKYWQTEPAWEWARAPFPGGMREKLQWKLSNRQVEKSYYRAINDDELFLFAIAADLRAYGGYHGAQAQQAWNPTLDDVLSVTYKVFSQEVVSQPGGGWLLQPGVWSDHPDFKYAGNAEARPGIQPAPVRDIAWDSSHFYRFPLWLTSYMRAYPPRNDRYHFYEDLRSGLEKQFFNKVLVRPTSDYPCFRLNNYMDGSNGVYRWNYQSLGANTGYGPYELSSSLLMGWWAFVDTDRARAVYHDLAAQFPWPKQCIELYLGPTPSHTHPATALDPESSTMRLWHILVQLAAQI